jgi:hypothetical protein
VLLPKVPIGRAGDGWQVGLCVGPQGQARATTSRLDRNGLHGASLTGGVLRLEDCDVRCD